MRMWLRKLHVCARRDKRPKYVSYVIRRDVCGLEAMLNSFHVDNVVATSESELEDELVSISGQLPSELAAQIPSVVVENSSDIHIGPRLQYNGPVTVKQYITVKAKDDIDSSSGVPSNDASATHLQQPEVVDPLDAALKFSPKDVLTFHKHTWLSSRCVWISLACALVLAIIIAVAFALSEAEPGSMPPNEVRVAGKIHFQCEKEYVDVYEGEKSVQWVVNVTAASSHPKLVWYGPNCTVLQEHDGPTRLQVYTSPTGTLTKLKLYNISVKDRGLYRLQARSGEEEDWAYFTLNVKGKNPLDRQHVVVCYVAEWAHTRRDLGMFSVDNIEPTLCTHLVYAFANLSITRNAIESRSPDYDLEENNGTGAYRKMTSLKAKHPHLKVLLAMGGWAEKMDKNYSEVVESPSRRRDLVSSISEFLRKYNFDGLDVHWQYPVDDWWGSVVADKENFVSLLKELREEFDKFGWLLTAPLGVMPGTIERSYNIPAVSKYLDYMFALCYAYHGHWDSQTGPNAPLYPRFADDVLNVEASINTLLFKGAAREKLVLGLPLYGRIFKLKDTGGIVGFQKPTQGPGKQGDYVQEPGFWGYNEGQAVYLFVGLLDWGDEGTVTLRNVGRQSPIYNATARKNAFFSYTAICMVVNNPDCNWMRHWDNVTHTPYAFKDNQFISYDDERSLTEKVELAVHKKLAGVVVWSLDTDDFRGYCTFGKSGSTTYPLMRAINNALDNSVSWRKVPCNLSSPAKGPVN